MQTPQSYVEEVTQQETPKIHLPKQVFGKPTKDRTNDPSMFDLLTWNVHGVEQSNFKSKQKCKDAENAYLNMISKKKWISEAQQSYSNFQNNAIEVDTDTFQEIQNYIEAHQSKEQKRALMKKSQEGSENAQYKVNHSYKNNRAVSTPKSQKKEPIRQKQGPQRQQQYQIPQSVRQSKIQQNRPSSAAYTPNQGKQSLGRRTQPEIQSISKQQQYFMEETEMQQGISAEEQSKLIENFKQTTRWIPNSSFTTYFGKPPFENYGRGNTKPIDGGLVYGTYLYSHNVYPHRGSNQPSKVQSYPVALMKAKSMGTLKPTQPKTACAYLQNKENNEKERMYDCSGAIEAAHNQYNDLLIQTPDLRGVEKFGGQKKLTKSRLNTKSSQGKSGFSNQ